MSETHLITGQARDESAPGRSPVTPGEHGIPLRVFVTPSSVLIPSGSPRRRPPRPVELRGPDYDEKFDADTLYYDVFRSGDQVVAFGPPMLNTATDAANWRFTADGRPTAAPRTTELDHYHRAVFHGLPDHAAEIGVADGTAAPGTAAIGADLAPLFAGRRAMMTLQLDNDLEWIRDWAQWHVRAHGTDAIVVYDNGSRRYGLDELADALAVPGIRAVAVVDWSYLYGPQGSDVLPWDSDFAQYAAIEHARHRILRQAAGMLSVDIDELVQPIDGSSVYRQATTSRFGYALFRGTWVYADPTGIPGRPRHLDCRWTRPDDAATPAKWCAVPSRLPQHAQLTVHAAHGFPLPQAGAPGYWHARPISTNWKEDRSKPEHDPATFLRDARVEDQLDGLLGAPPEPVPVRSAEPGVPLLRVLERLRYLQFLASPYIRRVIPRSNPTTTR